ncbi:MAG TPA: ATP-binding protein [Kofleriaceae bacterium]|nr:ATP-binding protein [Kofleriaceae bacterium]
MLSQLRSKRYLSYSCAFALVALTVAGLSALEIEPPTVVVLMLPILASAYLGELGPGLLATTTASLGAFVFLSGSASPGSRAVHLLALAVAGAAMTLVIEALHRSRHHAQRSKHDSLQSQTLFAYAFAGSPSAMSLSRAGDTVVVEVNQAYLDTFEIDRERLIGRSLIDAGVVVENVDRAAVFAELRARGALMIPDVVIRTPAGTVKTVTVSAQLIELDGESYALSTLIDTTDRKRAEAAAATSEAQFRELAETIREVFWLTDPGHTKMLYVSPAYEPIFGRSREAVYADGRDWMRAIHMDDRPRLDSFVTGHGPLPRSDQFRIVRDGGAVATIRINVFPVLDASGAVVRVAGMAEDITEWLELEEQVRQTQKLESLGLLAGGIAHDFNNILAVIGANIGLLAESAEDPDDRELISEIEGAVGRATAMTRQLLAFSRKQVTEPVVIDLNSAIADTRKMLRRMVGDDVVIATSLEPELGRVRIDPGHLVQVLMNLAVNARDAMAHGGTLTLTTRNVHGKARAEVMLSVTDTGCGIAPEVKERVFEPLFTTKGTTKGTGLGLSVVHGIIEEAGGRIELHTELGVGTTFEIYLPAVDAPIEKIDDVAIAGAHGDERIVFVDDDLYVRATASRALRSRGYTVLEASDAQAALQLLRDHGDAIDLLVTDVVMPSMDGRELAEAARRERPTLRVLYTSGYTDDAVLRHGVRQAEVAFIEKPFRIHALAGKVRQVLDAT